MNEFTVDQATLLLHKSSWNENILVNFKTD